MGEGRLKPEEEKLGDVSWREEWKELEKPTLGSTQRWYQQEDELQVALGGWTRPQYRYLVEGVKETWKVWAPCD